MVTKEINKKTKDIFIPIITMASTILMTILGILYFLHWITAF